MSYTVAVKREFVGQHFLIGGDWGAENEWHSHHYYVEVQLEGDALDKHGYLVDIVDIESNLEALVAHYKDKTLNDLPEFTGLNPSIEHFSRIFATQLALSLVHLTVEIINAPPPLLHLLGCIQALTFAALQSNQI